MLMGTHPLLAGPESSPHCQEVQKSILRPRAAWVCRAGTWGEPGWSGGRKSVWLAIPFDYRLYPLLGVNVLLLF